MYKNVFRLVIVFFVASFVEGANPVSNRGLLVNDLDPKTYIFVSDSLGNDSRLWPSVGNGHVAMVAHSPFVLMNGFYNGRSTQSHRAAIPSPLKVNLTSFRTGKSFHRTYSLDTRIGVYEELVVSDACAVILRWFCHRSMHSLLVFEVFINRTSDASPDNCQILLNVTRFGVSDDVLFTERPIKFHNVSYMYGETLHPETDWSGNQSVHVIFDKIPDSLALPSKRGRQQQSWTFLASIHSTRKTAFRDFTKGSAAKTSGDLFNWHRQSWSSLWDRGRLDVEGNVTVARATAASFYNIFISLPDREDPLQSFVGLSPCGLSWGDNESYFGHVFWDQETWMYPPLLVLHAHLGHMLIRTRARTAAMAERNANETGYLGYRFPWESAFTGVETSDSATCAQQEIHINGDIAFAIMQYVWATGKISVFAKEPFGKIILGIGDFWISRSRYNSTRQLYDILGVMPPDEYVENVNNSAFTNMMAIRSLESAAFVALYLGFLNHTIYEYYARHIYMPFDKKLMYHPEYEGYVQGKTVKQADVILMGFPFMWEMPAAVRLNDLEIYEKVTSVKGPAMSDSMFAIGWLEQKQYNKAVTSFNRMFDHIAGDFQVWTETKHGEGATNFITGMGGFLQATIFGFCGVRLGSNEMNLDPVLPPGATRMKLTGLDYRGTSLDIDVTNETIVVLVTHELPDARGLWLRSGQTKQRLYVNEPVVVKRGKITLQELSNVSQLNRFSMYGEQRPSVRRFYKPRFS